jgi:hypothetical protein
LGWNFNQADPNQHLTEICWSNLDYAVIGYACECLDDAGRKAALETIGLKITTIEDAWHPSVTDLMSEWNRLLSRFQPYARASSIAGSGEDWLTENQTFLPFDKTQNWYAVMKFNVA